MKLIIWIIGFAIGITIAGRYDLVNHPSVCKSNPIVKEIISVAYRTVQVKLEDGSVISLDQPTVKPGSRVCIK